MKKPREQYIIIFMVIIVFVYLYIGVILPEGPVPIIINFPINMLAINGVFILISKWLCKCPRCCSKIPLELFRGKNKKVFCPFCKEVLADPHHPENVSLQIANLRASKVFDVLSTIVFFTCLLIISIYTIVIKGSLFVIVCSLVLLLGSIPLRFGLIPYPCPTCHTSLPQKLLLSDKENLNKTLYCPYCAAELRHRISP